MLGSASRSLVVVLAVCVGIESVQIESGRFCEGTAGSWRTLSRRGRNGCSQRWFCGIGFSLRLSLWDPGQRREDLTLPMCGCFRNPRRYAQHLLKQLWNIIDTHLSTVIRLASPVADVGASSCRLRRQGSVSTFVLSKLLKTVLECT